MTGIRVALIGLLTIAGTSAAQNIPAARVPAGVQRTLHGKFSASSAATWSMRPDSSFAATFMLNGASTRVSISPAGEWIETATEIGAISLPAPVRSTIIGSYRGFRFAETRRVVRAKAPLELFEVRLEKAEETRTVLFDASGKTFATRPVTSPVTAMRPIPSPAGTWRGSSLCLPGFPACHDETVVYRVTPVASDSNGFDMDASKIVNGTEDPMGKLVCTLDRGVTTLVCVIQAGVWRFKVSRDSLLGGLTATNGRQMRKVAVGRQP